MSFFKAVGAPSNTLSSVLRFTDCDKQAVGEDEEFEDLFWPSEDDVGGPVAEDPSCSGAEAGGYPYQPLLAENHIRLLLIESLDISEPSSTQDSACLCHTAPYRVRSRKLEYSAVQSSVLRMGCPSGEG